MKRLILPSQGRPKTWTADDHGKSKGRPVPIIVPAVPHADEMANNSMKSVRPGGTAKPSKQYGLVGCVSTTINRPSQSDTLVRDGGTTREMWRAA